MKTRNRSWEEASYMEKLNHEEPNGEKKEREIFIIRSDVN